MALGAKDILVMFTFKRLKPCEVKGVGKLAVNNPENWDYFFILSSVSIFVIRRSLYFMSSRFID